MCSATFQIDTIRLNKCDFGRASMLAEYVLLRYVGQDHVLIETNRYSRRELTRNGIPFSYPNKPSCGNDNRRVSCLH